MTFKLLDTVVVRALRVARRRVDGTESVKRQPRVGDEGAIVHILGAEMYVVESVDVAGRTVWLADFHADELGYARPTGGP